jgi:hypothetical protein
MNATMLGLAVAIPCMVAFAFLMNRSNRLIGEVDQSAVRTLDILKQRYYGLEVGGEGEEGEEEGDEEAPAAPVRKLRAVGTTNRRAA